MSDKNMKKYNIFSSFYHYFPLICILLIVFDLMTTVRFAVLSMEKSARDTISRAESQIRVYVRSVWNLGNAIAAAPATRDASLTLRQRAQALIPYVDAYDLFMLGITDKQGLLGSTLHRKQITSKAMLTREGIGNLSSRPSFQESMATGKSILTDIYLAGADGKTRIYTIWIPYRIDGEIAGVITVSIKFAFISHLIESTSLEDNYYFALLDSKNRISANTNQSLIGKNLEEAYSRSLWASISLEDLGQRLHRKETGSYWGINNNRLEYIVYTPVEGTPWKLIMRTNFFGSFQNAFFSLAIKVLIYITLFLLFSLKRNRDIFARERLYNMMTANINEVLFAYDTDTEKLIYISGNAERMLGLSEEKLMADPKALEAYIGMPSWGRRQARTENMLSWNCEIRDPETGNMRPFLCRMYLVLEGETHWAILVLTDIAEEQQQKKLLENALGAAERANLAKSTFLTNMSHDIRTPMNAIVGMTAIASAHIDDRERVLDCLSKISVANEHLLGLINDVLDMSKIESGKLALNAAPFSIAELCHNLITLIQPQIENKSLELLVDARRIVHEQVVGDTLRLNRIFINLVGNAVKFTAAGGTVRIRISEMESDGSGYGRYRFSFADSGIGISREFFPKLFLPFERAENSTVSKTEGSGLGLAISRQFATLMQGRIDVESTPGKGSCFTVTVLLPLGETDGLDRELPEWTGHRVLLADGDRMSCESIAETLRSLGMEVDWVHTGEEAVSTAAAAQAEGRRYHLLFINWKLPGINGMETARRLREALDSPVPIVMLSAYDWVGIKKEAREVGVTEFMPKPLFLSDIYRVLTKLHAADEEPESPPATWPDFSARRILLVEDNELNMEIALEILSLVGVAVESAWNGREAVEKVAAAPVGYYDMVITDIQMPLMNGYDAAAAIRALEREDAKTVPIIAMTANVFSDDIQRSKEVGMNEHLAKPIDIHKLIEILQRWL